MTDDIIAILNSFNGLVLEDEDGQPLGMSIRQSASEEHLRHREQMLKTPLPADLKALLRFSDGIELFGQHIMSVAELTYHRDEGVLAFHNWGNGDFDCIAIQNSKYPDGTVVFMNHSPHVLVAIESSLSNWLVRVVGEIREKGTLLHPADYRNRDDTGIYGHVLDELREVDCELNRWNRQ